jgi:TPR repeat protein
VTTAASSSQIAPEQTGAEEMATAAKYLSGTEGMPRDSREAASWLWKAVGKGNPAATMALSDLYLRGDGVAKSCDQARLLLDAAARKGQHAAAERIRNLQAFGCQ